MRWIFRRILLMAFTIYAVVTLTFFLARLMPGNPIDYLVNRLIQRGEMSYEDAMKYVQSFYGLLPDDPLPKQYADYITSIFRGNFGKSFLFLGSSVNEIIANAIPWTVFLVSTSLLISFGMGILFGMLLAYRRGTKLDSTLTATFTVMSSVPAYMVALLMLYFLGFILKLFPVRGAYSIGVTPGFNLAFIASVLFHSTLPALSFVITNFGFWALGMRGSTITVLGEDYVMAAKARGLKERRIAMSYVGKNAILPLFTSFMISMGFMMGGAVFIETIFSYPGIGYYLMLAVAARDYTLIQGCFFVIIVAVIIGNFLADLLYTKLDPRIKRE